MQFLGIEYCGGAAAVGIGGSKAFLSASALQAEPIRAGLAFAGDWGQWALPEIPSRVG